MKSEVITIDSKEECTEQALDLTENFFSGCSKKSLLRLRLLAEETMNLIRSITGDSHMLADFWLEKDGNLCSVHLITDTIMYAQKRQELLELSTTKENEAAKGVLGKIREVFELALLPKDERTARESRIGMMGLIDPTGIQSIGAETWMMSAYIDSIREMEERSEFVDEAREEIEKSILANIAKDVIIGIVGDEVSMVIEYELESQT